MSSGERLPALPNHPPERLRSGVQPIARAANDQHSAEPPHELTDEECEGAAQGLLVEIGAEQHPTPIAAYGIARALGLSLSPRSPSGCRGVLDLDAWTLRYDGRGDPEAVGQRLAHELGHLAGAWAGLRAPHPERSIDRVAAALVLPRAAVRMALRRECFDPVRLLGALAGAPPAWTLLRAAWVAERTVIVLMGGERWAYAPDGLPTPAAGAWERDVAAIVRRTGRPHRDLLGGEAWPVGFRERPGVVILPAG